MSTQIKNKLQEMVITFWFTYRVKHTKKNSLYRVILGDIIHSIPYLTLLLNKWFTWLRGTINFKFLCNHYQVLIGKKLWLDVICSLSYRMWSDTIICLMNISSYECNLQILTCIDGFTNIFQFLLGLFCV